VSSSGIHKRLLGALGLLAGIVLASVASPAFAHDELLGADPAPDAVVETLPASITLTFSGVLLGGDGTTEVAVTDAGGQSLTDGAPVLDGVRVTQSLTGEASGPVTVKWRVVSSDGHPISGDYSFAVGDGMTVPSGSVSVPLESDDASVELLPVWIVIGVIVVAGVVVTLVLTRKRPSRED